MKHDFRPGSMLALSVALCAWVPAQDAPAPTAAEVLARMQRWRGGEALTALASVRARGKVTIGGLDGTTERILGRTGEYRFQHTLGERIFGEGIDEVGGWRQNQSGQVDSIGEQDLQRRRQRQRGWFDGFGGAAVELAPPEQRGGRTCDVVRVQRAWADPLDLLIAADGELVAERSRMGGAETLVEFSDWRAVDGVRWPFREALTSESQDRTVVWQSIEAVPAAGPFLARPESAVIGALPADSQSVALDLQIHQGYLFVHGTLQGRETDFLLDTGASMTVVNRKVAEELRLPLEGEFAAGGAGSRKRETKWAGQVAIALGAATLRPRASSFALTEIARGLGRDVDAVLGRELLLAFAVEIDYRNHKLVLHDPAAFAPPAGAQRVPVHSSPTGHVEVLAQIEDLEPAPFLLDTGAPVAVILNTPYIEANAALQGRKGAPVLMGGVGGGNGASMATLAKVGFGGHVFAEVPALFAKAERGAMAMREHAGIVGTQILSRFHAVLDLSHGALWLSPGEGIDAPFGGRRRTAKDK